MGEPIIAGKLIRQLMAYDNQLDYTIKYLEDYLNGNYIPKINDEEIRVPEEHIDKVASQFNILCNAAIRRDYAELYKGYFGYPIESGDIPPHLQIQCQNLSEQLEDIREMKKKIQMIANEALILSKDRFKFRGYFKIKGSWYTRYMLNKRFFYLPVDPDLIDRLEKKYGDTKPLSGFGFDPTNSVINKNTVDSAIKALQTYIDQRKEALENDRRH